MVNAPAAAAAGPVTTKAVPTLAAGTPPKITLATTLDFTTAETATFYKTVTVQAGN